jgi:hypothetical protein
MTADVAILGRGLRLGEPEKVGRGVLNLLLSLLLSWKETGAGFACALRSVAVLVGCAPAADRGAMSPVLTSGAVTCHTPAIDRSFLTSHSPISSSFTQVQTV